MKTDKKKAIYDVIMTDFGEYKLKVIAHVRGITGLGLADTKQLVENLPARLKKDASKDEADAIKEILEDLGAKIVFVVHFESQEELD